MVINTAANVTIDDTADIVVGSTIITAANINSPKVNDQPTSFVIETAAGVTFDSATNVVIGSTTIVRDNINKVTKVIALGILQEALLNEWTMAITAQGITNRLMDNSFFRRWSNTWMFVTIMFRYFVL